MATATFTTWSGEEITLCSDVPDEATASELSRYAQIAYERGRREERALIRDQIENQFRLIEREHDFA